MTRLSLVALAFPFLLLCACATPDEKRFVSGKGDLAQFIVGEASAHGARPITTNNLPVIAADWRYFQDTNGAVVRLHHRHFPQIQSLLRQTFGPPDHDSTPTTDGGQLGWYAAKTIGIGIQFSSDPKNTQVIIIRPQKNWQQILIRAAEHESQTSQ